MATLLGARSRERGYPGEIGNADRVTYDGRVLEGHVFKHARPWYAGRCRADGSGGGQEEVARGEGSGALIMHT